MTNKTGLRWVDKCNGDKQQAEKLARSMNKLLQNKEPNEIFTYLLRPLADTNDEWQVEAYYATTKLTERHLLFQ